MVPRSGMPQGSSSGESNPPPSDHGPPTLPTELSLPSFFYVLSRKGWKREATGHLQSCHTCAGEQVHVIQVSPELFLLWEQEAPADRLSWETWRELISYEAVRRNGWSLNCQLLFWNIYSFLLQQHKRTPVRTLVFVCLCVYWTHCDRLLI